MLSSVQSSRGGCSCNLELGMGITATGLAVAGVALAIFTGVIWAIIGFALLGVLAIFLTIKGSLNLKELKKSVDDLKTVDQRLNGQIGTLQQRVNDLTHTTEALQSENAQLQQSQAKWAAEQETLNGQIAMLEAQKKKLESDLNSLSLVSSGLQKQVQDFLASTLEMGKAVGAFQQSEEALKGTGETFEKIVGSLDQTFSSHLGDLAGDIALAKTTSETIFTHLSEQHQSQKAELALLKQSNEQFQSNEATLVSENLKLKQEWDAISKKTAQLEELVKQFSAEQTRLTQEKAALEEQYQKLEQQKQTLEIESNHLQAVQTPLQGNLTSAQDAIELLGKTLADRQGQLKRVDALLIQKLGDLKMAKEELAALHST